MSKLICLLLALCMFITFAGCEVTANQEITSIQKTLNEEELHNELETIFNQICSANDDCEELALLIIDGWNMSNFERDYFDYMGFASKKQYLNDGYIATVEKVHTLRNNIPSKVLSVQDKLKEYSHYSDDAYYQAIKNLYLSLDSFSNFATSFPEGYSLLTYRSEYNNHHNEFSNLISSAKFEK